MTRRLGAAIASLALAGWTINCSSTTTPVAPDNVVAQGTPPTPFSLAVSSPQPELFQRGSTVQLTATLTLSNGFTENRTSSVSWSSSNSAVASVSSSGLVTAGDEGTATISATLQGLSSQVGLRVRNAFRTPDPPPGQRLPKPDVSRFVRDFFFANPALVARSCQDAGGTWEFLDGLVDALRVMDLRWAYNGRRGDPSFVARDEIAYHAGAGASLLSRETYAWDIMGGHCGTNPQPSYFDVTDLGTIWVTRDRFTVDVFVKP